jgi:CubicO group peptidase (beta-lactamase class C family)
VRSPARTLVAILVLVAAAFASVATATDDPDADPIDLAAIDAFVEASMRRHGIPGVALAIVRDGELLHARGYGRDGNGGPMTASTPMYIGSVSKSFTALAILQLVDAGRIELHAPLRRYLPWFEVGGAYDGDALTIQHLLAHASGLSDLRYLEATRLPDDASLEDAVRDLRAAQPVAAPGETFHYFNPNYLILGLVVEAVSGRSYEAYLREHVLQPLGMHGTFTRLDAAHDAGLAQGHALTFGIPLPREQPFRAYGVPAGYLISTAEDMARYLQALLDDGRHGDVRLLSRASMISLFAPSRPSGVYAKGWFVGEHRGHRLIRHGGTNEFFKAEAMLLPDDDLGLVLLANQSTLPTALFGYPQLAGGVLDLLVGTAPSTTGPGMRWVGYALALAFALQLAWLARSFARLPRWPARARRAPRWRIAAALTSHLVAIPALTLGIVALLEAWMGRGVSLSQAFDGVPDVATWLLVAYLADLALLAGKVAALVRGRRTRDAPATLSVDPSARSGG